MNHVSARLRWATLSVAGSVFHAAALLILLLAGCTTLEVYRGYPGPDLPDASVATVELNPSLFGKRWARIDDVEVDGEKFRSVKLLPGVHRIEWNRTFGVSFLVDPRMFVEYKHSATVTLDAGRTYRLQSDRTTGPGYRVYFWIEDAVTGNVVHGSKKP